ncbi:MAG: RNA polymerase factor sigma-54 [Oligoflexia bacterium]|nr:RNA polymerase factor sigma-54 [Oligoflexia bacterium]
MKLSLNLSQKLAISQRLQQSLSILSLSNEELDELIQKELLENPFLEREESFFLKDSQKFRMYDSLEADTRPVKKTTEGNHLTDFPAKEETLKEYVLKQVQQSFFSKEIKKILRLLISYLDERAYLRVNMDELSKQEDIPKSLMNKALKALQSFEPVGLGARSLEECLILQLRQKKEPQPKAELIARYYLSALRDRKYPYIAGELNLSLEKTKRLCQIIEKLQPNPAVNFSSEPTLFVRPDLYIYKQGESYHVIFNTENLTPVRFSHDYLRAVERSGKLRAQERKYLKNKTTEARFFIHAIHQRQEQMKKIAYYIIGHQWEFFEKGKTGLRALTMMDLAEKMSVHVSTISRTVSNKYVHTPHGLMALKTFFVKGAWTLSGERVSVEAIKRHIKKWVLEENPERPLSDEQIKSRISECFQVAVTRRRVAQYRLEMSLPSARLRKLQFLHSQSSFLNSKVSV